MQLLQNRNAKTEHIVKLMVKINGWVILLDGFGTACSYCQTFCLREFQHCSFGGGDLSQENIVSRELVEGTEVTRSNLNEV